MKFLLAILLCLTAHAAVPSQPQAQVDVGVNEVQTKAELVRDLFIRNYLSSELPTMILFSEESCEACKGAVEDWNTVAKKYKDKVTFHIIYLDKNPEYGYLLGVRGTPCFALFYKGNLIHSMLGRVPTASLAPMIDRVLQFQKDYDAAEVSDRNGQ